MPKNFSIFVSGHVAPGGSKNHAFNKRTGKIMVYDAGVGNAEWKARVKFLARRNYPHDAPMTGPIEVIVWLYVFRPKHHYRTGKNSHMLKATAAKYPTTKPDATKLWRSTEDALTGVVWTDDALIVDQHVFKRFCTDRDDGQQGAQIDIREIEI